MDRRIAPLNSRTRPWRKHLKKGDRLDVRLELAASADDAGGGYAEGGARVCWVLGSVLSVDHQQRNVVAKCSQRAVEGARARAMAASSSSASFLSRVANFVGIGRGAGDASSEVDGSDSESSSDDEEKEGGVSVMVVHSVQSLDLDGGSICPAYTHTPMPTAKPSRDGGGGGGGWLDYYNPQPEGGVPPLGLGRVGNRNLGNTCYMNSVLQCMTHAEFVKALMLSKRRFREERQQVRTTYSDGDVATALRRHSRDQFSNKYRVLVPSGVKSALANTSSANRDAFGGRDQNDCCEFFEQLKDQVHEDMNRASQRFSGGYQKKPALHDVHGGGDVMDHKVAREAWTR